MTLTYELFFDQDPQHRGLLKLATGTAVVLSRDARSVPLEGNTAASVIGMVKSGMTHIWAGLDHLLFLVALLLPSVLRRDGGQWKPLPAFRPAFLDVLKIVTSFTVAHSLTLSLAALGLVQLPSRLVELAIALSVVLAAVNNLKPFLGGDRWLVAFALGLLHGFGFSATLVDLQLSGAQLLWSLLGFNLGVELGQLAVLVVFVPVAFVVRGTVAYRRIALMGGSAAILLVSCVWLAERALY
jgi:hypothetical protein